MSDSIPYLGSKISLISKSEIRYEGILYTIDAQESIIALAKVQSFGTEDRQVEIPVPAKNEVYEYIIFRGTDIKKIEVCESPKQPLSGGLHNDPAIVGLQQHAGPSMQSSYPAGSFNRQPLGPIGSMSGPYYGSGYGQIGQQSLSSTGGFSIGTSQPSELNSGLGSSMVGSVSIEPVSSGSNQPNLAPIGAPAQISHSQTQKDILAEVLSGSRSSTPSVSRKSPVSDAGVQVTPPPQAKQKSQPNQRSPQERSTNYRNSREANNYQQNRRGGGGGGGQNFYQSGQQRPGGYQGGGYNNQYQGYVGGGRGGPGGGGGMRGRGGPRRPTQPRGRGYNQGNRQRQDHQAFAKEFDFEQANEEFEELRTQLAKTKISENGDSSTVPSEENKEDSGHETLTTGDGSDDGSIFYDKAKSFFDSISCEALERSKGKSQRPDWRQERKINVQTFGVATARRGYYPRGGRGGYYNRGGYYRNNYNQGYYRGNSGGNDGYRGGSRGGGYNNYNNRSQSYNNTSAPPPSSNQNSNSNYASGSTTGTQNSTSTATTTNSTYASAAKSATAAN